MERSLPVLPFLSIVIPCYNEGAHLKTVLESVQKELVFLNDSYELILVDDGSPDDTWTVIEDESKRLPMLRAVQLSRNFGKESALCAGLEMARGRAVLVMDADLQHPLSLIPEMVRLWRESGVDVVEAVKENRGSEPLMTRIGAKLFHILLSKFSGYHFEGASDYKLMDRRVVDAWLKMGERNLFFRGMIHWLGFKRIQIPFVVPERIGGQSRWSFFRLVRLAIVAMTSFSSMPLHIVTFSGAIFLLFALILTGQTLFMKITGRAVSGFTTVILLLLIIGSLLMISLGVVGEYIARIYEEVKSRPRYVVSQKIDQTEDERVWIR